jgi:hypothetical protein
MLMTAPCSILEVVYEEHYRLDATIVAALVLFMGFGTTWVGAKSM